MASLDTGGDGGHKKGPGVKKAKKQSTRVDMTPMVDLAFLLITFFIYTTTMATPSTLKLSMPKDEKDEKNLTEVKQSGALTVMMGKNDAVFYYEGELLPDASNFKSTTFKGIREVIQNKKANVKSIHRHDAGCQKIWDKNNGDQKSCLDKDFMVIIKPNEESTYKNTVDILDEMKINAVQRYAIIDILPVENELIRRTQASSANQ